MELNNTNEGIKQPDLKAQLKGLEEIKSLFARAHDYIAQASHPGHMSVQVAEVLSFLKFHYEDFKGRVERVAKQVENEAKAEASKVDVKAAKALTEAVLTAKQDIATEAVKPEEPKA